MELLDKEIRAQKRIVKWNFETPDGYKLGHFQKDLIKIIDGKKICYVKYMSAWREKYPETFAFLDEKVRSKNKT